MRITTTRVSERGRVTGSADLAVERAGDAVYLKLGLTRVKLDPAQQDQLVAAVRGPDEDRADLAAADESLAEIAAGASPVPAGQVWDDLRLP